VRADLCGISACALQQRGKQRAENCHGGLRFEIEGNNVADGGEGVGRKHGRNGIKPVWRAINGAVPLAAEGHHFALESIEAVTM